MESTLISFQLNETREDEVNENVLVTTTVWKREKNAKFNDVVVKFL